MDDVTHFYINVIVFREYTPVLPAKKSFVSEKTSGKCNESVKIKHNYAWIKYA